MKEKVRQILEQEYYTPPIVSGKIWQDRATERICQLYEDKIQQAKTEVAREIFEEIEGLYPYTVFDMHPSWQSLKDRFLKEKK